MFRELIRKNKKLPMKECIRPRMDALAESINKQGEGKALFTY